MKGIFVILDGLGDLPCKALGDKTPLESAKTPNMDFLATRGEMGYLYPVKPTFIPGSDEATLSIFGNEVKENFRGRLEAKGTKLDLKKGDLALRVNFSTIDSVEKGNILDRRVGRTLTSKEAKKLSEAINSEVKTSSEFVLEPTIQHRGVLIFRGNFSDKISGNDSRYMHKKNSGEDSITECKPLDKNNNSQISANLVNEFIEKAHNVLKEHPVNKKRIKRGLLPANYLLVRGAGSNIPKIKQYKKWMSVTYMPLEIGFSKSSGMEIFSFTYPPLKKLDSYKNLWEGLRKACKYSIKHIKKNHKKFDYAYIHIKETDLPGHDNKPIEKKSMLEYIDKTLFKFLKNFAPQKDIKVLATGDHSTPCKLKDHSADPVPVLFYNGNIPREKKFNEKEAKKGKLGRMQGHEILKKAGFVK